MSMKRPFLRRAARVISYLVFGLVACVAVLFAVLLAWSPGRAEPFVDASGSVLPESISEKARVKINGVEQGMFIKGKDKKNPILLFIHGGPGMPEYAFNRKYPTGLEDIFTVCWWEHRNAGMSYDPETSPDGLTLEVLAADAIAVTDHLRERFGQDKIYLMAHSGGTYTAIHAAAQAPEKYHAYIAVAQIARQLESEKLAYGYMIEEYKKAGNTEAVARLEQYPILESEAAMRAYLPSLARDDSMHDLGIGTMRSMRSVATGVLLPVFRCPEYTLGEKLNIWRGKLFFDRRTNLRYEAFSKDMATKVPRVGVPIYFFSGRHDYTVSYALARRYYEVIEAPKKGFYTFADSAHSPIFEEPLKAQRILREDVLKGATALADRE
jgi:pimeloyl-ACP methyl ester carboxylesterase